MKIQQVIENTTLSKWKTLRPNELRGSYTDQQLQSLGFRKNPTSGQWFILRTKWEQLVKNNQISETSVSKTNRSRNEIGYKNWNEIQRAVRHSSSNTSDPRHSARLTIDGREVVISKQSAEQLFRWLKKNFKTKHERELYDFLAHQRLLGVLDDVKSLNEINYASVLAGPTISKKEIIANSTENGTIGSRKVFLYSRGDNKIYYFERNSDIDALVYIFKDRLLGMKNYSDNRGLIFNLLQFVINIKNKTLRLTASDKLTSDGLQWIIRQIKSKSGFNITDAQGNAIDPDVLYNEWEQARTTEVHGPTEIVISKSSNSNSIKENEERLMPMDIWGVTLLHTASNAVDMSQLFETDVHIENSNETLLELAPSEPHGEDNRPERPLSLADVAKIIKARLGSDWTMQRVGRTEQPGYKFIPTDKTKHGMAKIWCLVDWNKIGEYPTYNTILFAYEQKDGKIMAHGRHTEKTKHKSVSNALETAQLILKNDGGLKDAVTEGTGQQPGQFEIINLRTMQRAYHPFEANDIIDAQIKADDWLEAIGKSGRGLMVRPVKEQDVAEGIVNYSDEEIERYGPELTQRQRNLDLLASIFGYQNIHRVARALRAGNLKRRLKHNEGTPEERAQYSRAVRILDSMTDESGNIMPHTDTAVYRRK